MSGRSHLPTRTVARRACAGTRKAGTSTRKSVISTAKAGTFVYLVGGPQYQLVCKYTLLSAPRERKDSLPSPREA